MPPIERNPIENGETKEKEGKDIHSIEEYIKKSNFASTEGYEEINSKMEGRAKRNRELQARQKANWKYRAHKAVPAIMIGTIHIAFIASLILHHKTFLVLSAVYALYQAYLTSQIAFFQSITLMKYEKHKKRDWKSYYEAEKTKIENTAAYLEHQEQGQHIKEWNDVVHYIIIPNYKETMEILEQTLQNIVDTCGMTKTHIIPVLAMEEREVDGPAKAASLIQQFKEEFKEILVTYHPPNLPFDVPGKSSNERWAAKIVEKHAIAKQHDETTIVTICDADSLFTRNYFECLTAKYCLDIKDRDYTIHQAPIMHYHNLFDVPLFTKIVTLVVSMHEIAAASATYEERVPFSTYSLSLKLAQEVGGWDGDVIPEDWHMYIKCVMKTNGRTTIKPIYLPVSNYSVQANTYWESCKERWLQAKRHAWGISEIPHYLGLLLTDPTVKKRPLLRNLKLFYKISSLHVLAGTQWFYFGMASMFCTILGVCKFVYPESAYIDELIQWSKPFQIINLISLVPIVFGLYQNTHLMLGYSQQYAKAYNKEWSTSRKLITRIGLVFYFCIIWNIGFGPAVLFFTYIPTLIAAVKLIFHDNIKYDVATKATSHGSNLDAMIDSDDDSEVNIDVDLLEVSSDEVDDLV